MSETTELDRQRRRYGIAGFVAAIIGFVFSIGVYIIFFLCGSLGMIPDMPELRLALLIVTAVILFAAFIMEGISSLKEAQPKWMLMLAILLWVLGALFCTIMFTGIFA